MMDGCTKAYFEDAIQSEPNRIICPSMDLIFWDEVWYVSFYAVNLEHGAQRVISPNKHDYWWGKLKLSKNLASQAQTYSLGKYLES